MHLFMLLSFLASLGWFGWQVRRLLLGRASRTWRTTKGRVTRSQIDEQITHDKYGGTNVSYLASVEYVYWIGAQHFTSTHLTYEPTTSLSKNAIRQLLQGIDEGKDVDVYCDSHNFEHAVLIRGTSSGNYLQLVVSIVILALVAFGYVFVNFVNAPAPH